MDSFSPWRNRIPVHEIRKGTYSDQYFNNVQNLLLNQKKNVNVVMQFFQKQHSVLGGIEETLAVLQLCSGYQLPRESSHEQPPWFSGWEWLKVEALPEGSAITPTEPVLRISGPYHLFAHLETVILGILARRTLLRSNIEKVVREVNGKPLFFFPARHDIWNVQEGDGYVASLAGMKVCTPAQAKWTGKTADGSIPHSLIAAYGGDTVEAAKAFSREYGDKMDIVILVDFDNDCCTTAVEVAAALKDEGLPLWGVRLDTSESLFDRSLCKFGDCQGVCPALVRNVRDALDANGFLDVKISVSGGFGAMKIREFENKRLPVDAYGVGSSLLLGSNDFTADIVRVDGKRCAKVGREFKTNPRLETVK